ncbi:MAG: adenylate/guanylate cyclase domain-containing protein [Planctomycetes bacterium]|nr:adenylate/guanylate cyclase domain-containing protein [Planctomycetota bacterium]
MTNDWQLSFLNGPRLYVADLHGPAEIGRQESDLEPQPSHRWMRDGWRIVVAHQEERDVAPCHLRIEPIADNQLLVRNASDEFPATLASEQILLPGEERKVPLPGLVRLGRISLHLHPMIDFTQLRKTSASLDCDTSDMLRSTSDVPSMRADQLMDWIQAFVGLLRSAAGSDDFYVQAARALVELVDLDVGRVLLLRDSQWRVKARHLRHPNELAKETQPSTRILRALMQGKQLYWQVPELGTSTWGLDAVVVAPILDPIGNVIGALYGERRVRDGVPPRPICQLEAMLVEVLASGVAAGLARLTQERAALQSRLQMEQFFTPRLAAKLEDQPELLAGRDSNVSLLFCDIRGFSQITQALGPTKTVELISDVMSVLTQCVLDRDGVVVDYVGDEVLAMWGAPEDHPDHAVRACETALAMLASLPALNARWQPILQHPLEVGVGINSGAARVGNVGSRIKFKYGALGNTVNLGSRIQGATKFLKVPLLITDGTHRALSDRFATRRLCQARLVSMSEPVTLYELADPSRPGWDSLKRNYEDALSEFTRGEIRPACRILGRLIPEHPHDGPSLLLLSRAVACLVEPPQRFDPVMVFENK